MKVNFDIEQLKFNSHGLIPAVVVDAYTKKVLTLAYKRADLLLQPFTAGAVA